MNIFSQAGIFRQWTFQTAMTPLSHLVREFQRGELDIDIPCQRGDVWSLYDRQFLAYSMVCNRPLAAMYRNLQPSTGIDRLIDGKQRVLAAAAIYNDEVPMPSIWFPTERSGQVILPDGADEFIVFSDLTQTGQLALRNIPSVLVYSVTEEGADREEQEAELFRTVNFAGRAQGDSATVPTPRATDKGNL
jgi:hypothetical protein